MSVATSPRQYFSASVAKGEKEDSPTHQLQRGVGSDLHHHLAEVVAAQHLAEACRDVLKPLADVFAYLIFPAATCGATSARKASWWSAT